MGQGECSWWLGSGAAALLGFDQCQSLLVGGQDCAESVDVRAESSDGTLVDRFGTLPACLDGAVGGGGVFDDSPSRPVGCCRFCGSGRGLCGGELLWGSGWVVAQLLLRLAGGSQILNLLRLGGDVSNH